MIDLCLTLTLAVLQNKTGETGMYSCRIYSILSNINRHQVKKP